METGGYRTEFETRLMRRRAQARDRYHADREAQSRRVYLAALQAGKIRCPRESTLARHGISVVPMTRPENLPDGNTCHAGLTS